MRSMISVLFALTLATSGATAQVEIDSGGRRDSGKEITIPRDEIYLAAHEMTTEVDGQTGEDVLVSSTFYIADPNCTEGAFSEFAGILLRPNVDVNDVYVTASTQGVEITAVTHSRWPVPGTGDPCSQATPRPEFTVPPTQVDPAADLGVSLPLPVPLYVEQPWESRPRCC